MRMHDIVRDCETETEPRDLCLDRRTAIKALEDPVLFLRRYSGAVIGNFKADSGISIAHGGIGYQHRHRGAGRGILEGVVEHLFEGEFQQTAVERQLRRRSFGTNFNGPAVDLGVQRRHHVLDQLFRIGKFAAQYYLVIVVGLQARHVHRVID